MTLRAPTSRQRGVGFEAKEVQPAARELVSVRHDTTTASRPWPRVHHVGGFSGISCGFHPAAMARYGLPGRSPVGTIVGGTTTTRAAELTVTAHDHIMASVVATPILCHETSRHAVAAQGNPWAATVTLLGVPSPRPVSFILSSHGQARFLRFRPARFARIKPG